MIRQPSSVIIVGPSGSSKSELVAQWLRYLNVFQVKPKNVVYAYDRWQPRFDRMLKQDGIRFHDGLPDPSHLIKWFGPTRGGVLVLDDLMEEYIGTGQTRVGFVHQRFASSQHHRAVFDPRVISTSQILQEDQSQCPLHCGPQKPTGSKRAYGQFYCKPFRTVGVKSCAYLNASPPAPLDI